MPLPLVPIALKVGATIIPYLKQYWKELLVVGMAGMLLYQNFSDTRYLFWIETIPSLEARLEIAEDNYEVTKKGNERLAKAIEERNTQIDNWKKVSDKNAAEVERLQFELDNLKITSDKKVADILNDPTPKNNKEAIQYLRDGIEDVKW